MRGWFGEHPLYDTKGQPIVVNADQVIYVRSFGSIGKTEIAFAVAQQNEALCVVVEGTVDRIEPYGVFLAFPGGRGLVPASETGTERGVTSSRPWTSNPSSSATTS